MKEFTKGEQTIQFFIKPENSNYSFRVKNNELLTNKLLAICKKKTIKEKDFKYAVPALFEKLKEAINNDYYEIWLDDGIPYEKPHAIAYTKKQLYKEAEISIDYDIMILINGDFNKKIDPFYLYKYFEDEHLVATK